MGTSNCWELRPWMLPHRADFGLRGTADAVGVSASKSGCSKLVTYLVASGGAAQPSPLGVVEWLHVQRQRSRS